MRKFGVILVVLSFLAMAGAGFFYAQNLDPGDDGAAKIRLALYSGFGAGGTFLIGLVMLFLDSSSPAHRREEDEGSYDPYGGEEGEEDEDW